MVACLISRLGVVFSRDGYEHWFSGKIEHEKKHFMKSKTGKWMDIASGEDLTWNVARVFSDGRHLDFDAEECGMISYADVDEQCNRAIGMNHLLWTSASGDYAIAFDALPSAKGWGLRLREAHLHIGKDCDF